VNEPNEEFTVSCDWCHREVVSFVQPPAMVFITALAPLLDGSFWRICLPCYTELIKLIARLDWASSAQEVSQ